MHDKKISDKTIATSDTDIKLNSTSFLLFSCVSLFPESILLTVIVLFPCESSKCSQIYHQDQLYY